MIQAAETAHRAFAVQRLPIQGFELTDGVILIICAPNVLTAEELGAIRNELRGASYVDGASTAGWSAREVKKNLQVAINTESLTKLQETVRNAFLRSAELQASLLPFSVTQALFNRYDVGMTYGLHVDSALMGGLGNSVRSDVAITVFLSDPDTYDGGELVVKVNGLECKFKLEAGSVIAYPANSLHQVTPVTRGARYAAVIWVQSLVRDASKRELLWDLDNAKRQIFGKEGKSVTFDAISRSHANLLRMWADT